MKREPMRLFLVTGISNDGTRDWDDQLIPATDEIEAAKGFFDLICEDVAVRPERYIVRRLMTGDEFLNANGTLEVYRSGRESQWELLSEMTTGRKDVLL